MDTLKKGTKNFFVKGQIDKEVCSRDWNSFDPAYTGKAFAAYYEKYLKTGKGNQNIFVHTGGLFGVFGRTKEYLSN